MEIEGRVYPKSAKRADSNYQNMYGALYKRYEHAIKAGYDAPSQLIGMDNEGI
ncbi:MAG: hypothetical protein HOI19_14925, partial [Rhodospirillaceae bacterium]|nr:hypothetical protein [Rhodospirillaceae bacterium]